MIFERPWIAQYWRFHCQPKTTTVSAKLNWMAYFELPRRPFLGNQACSWTTLRRGNVFYYVYKRFFNFCHVFFTFFNVFFVFMWTFLHLCLSYASCCRVCLFWICALLTELFYCRWKWRGTSDEIVATSKVTTCAGDPPAGNAARRPEVAMGSLTWG